MFELSERERILRDKCSNANRFGACILSNFDIHFDARIATHSCDGRRNLFSHWFRYLIGTDGATQLAHDVVSGNQVANMIETNTNPLPELELYRLGFQTDVVALRWNRVELDSPEVMPEDLLMERATSLPDELVSQEMHFIDMRHNTMPYLLAEAPLATPARRQQIMDLVKVIQETWVKEKNKAVHVQVGLPQQLFRLVDQHRHHGTDKGRRLQVHAAGGRSVRTAFHTLYVYTAERKGIPAVQITHER